MEVPAMDDSMEMASPYLGQADDFDIDIDLMEDHTSNMDSDMMGADEYASTSQPQENTNDVIFDADMADGPSEGSMIDADNFVEEDNDIDVRSEGELYEAEMTEDVAPPALIPTAAAPDPLSTVKPNDEPDTIKVDEPTLTEQSLDAVPQISSNEAESIQAQSVPEPIPIQNEVTEQEVEDKNDQAERNTADDQTLTEPPTDIINFTEVHNEDETTEPSGAVVNETIAPSVSNPEVANAPLEDIAGSEEQPHEEQPQNEVSEVDASKPVDPKSVSQAGDIVSGGTESLHHESLHPVKIIYQENEIALFPPLEGDSAQTFFIQDEDVAYESVAQLFKALRQVLQGNVADNEVLVIDIEALGIQMTEDSFHTSQVTLHQIVDLYLKLCRNDSSNDPDALYLALSSKRAFPAEIADLLDAANDGKTLWDVRPWDDYDEAEPGSEDDHDHKAEEQEDEDYYTTEAEQKLSVPEDELAQRPADEQPVAANSSQIGGQNSNEAQLDRPQDLQSNEPDAEAAGDLEAQATSSDPKESDHPEKDQPQETKTQEFDNGHHDTNEEQYESEGPHSESTATVAAVPGETDLNEHSHDDQTKDVADDGTEQFDDEYAHGEDPEYDDLGPDEYYEDGEIGSHHPEAAQDQDISNDPELSRPSVGQTPVPVEEEESELDTPPATAATLAESLPDEVNQTSLEQSSSTVENGPQDTSDKKEQTPEPADDLLGIAVDLMQTPTKDTGHSALDHFDGLDYHEPEDEFAASAANANQDANDSEFEENNFGDYGIDFDETEAVELGETDPSFADSQSHENASTKRTREEDEDDWDVVDSTFDAKRRRPS